LRIPFFYIVSFFTAYFAQQVKEKERRLQDKVQELKSARHALVHAEKLAALGQLVTGIAHELNNPLTAILGLSDIMRQEPRLSDQQNRDLLEIGQHGERCRKIIQNLLHFARKRKPNKEPVQLSAVVELILELMRRDLAKANIAVARDIPESLPPAWADPGQLQQVVLNLVSNAMHAMEDAADGRLLIRVGRQEDRLTMSFTDNGCGIPEENLSRVFEPFFTTKPVGKGTGLGLSVSQGILAEHEGSIRVESRVGKGTTFFIELPVCREPTHPKN
jgi:C4-dicarboxylate-specific signal transduction histidine kinase